MMCMGKTKFFALQDLTLEERQKIIREAIREGILKVEKEMLIIALLQH